MARGNRKIRGALELESGEVQEGPVLAVAYIRWSTSGQEEGYTRELQLDKLTGLTKSLGAVVPDGWLIEEKGSGANRRLPGLRKVKEVVAGSKANGVRLFFAYDTSRVARHPLDVGLFVRHCKEHGVTPHFADGNSVETFMDEVIQYLKGAFAREEREHIAGRTMDGKLAAARANIMPNGVGRGRYGVHYDKHTKVWEVVEGEAVVVVMMFEWRLAGASCSEIARRLKDMGIRTKQGCEWTGAAVARTLRNEAYTRSKWWGTKRYENRYEEDDGPLREVTEKPEEEWIRLENFAPRIIEPNKFRAVQELMESNPRRGENWDYLLSSFFTCGECGSSVCGSTQYWSGDFYPYYRCSGTVRGDSNGIVCEMRAVRADVLEPKVIEHLKEAVSNPGEIVRGLERMAADDGEELKKRVTELQGKRRKLREQVADLTVQKTKNIIDQEMYERLAVPVNNLLARVDGELAVLEEQRKVSEGWELLEERVSAALEKYRESLDNLDGGELQTLMALVGLRITLIRGDSGEKRVLVTGLLGPSLVTTAQTSASPRGRSRRSRWA